MSEILRPGFPLRINTNLYGEKSIPMPLPQKAPETDESEYMLRWGEHNSQIINIFHQLCQVSNHHILKFLQFEHEITSYIKNIILYAFTYFSVRS